MNKQQKLEGQIKSIKKVLKPAKDTGLIQQIPGYKPSQCTCEKCQKMCLSSPCLPTPNQVLLLHKKNPELLKSGFQISFVLDRKTNVVFSVIAPIGHAWETNGKTCVKCKFYEGPCMLQYEHKFKPLEGKLAHHDVDTVKLRELFLQKFWMPSNPKAEDALLLFGDIEEIKTEAYRITTELYKNGLLI